MLNAQKVVRVAAGVGSWGDDVGEGGRKSEQYRLSQGVHEMEYGVDTLFIRCAEWLGYRRL